MTALPFARPAVFVAALLACTDATSPRAPDAPALPASALRMNALIDGRVYVAAAPDGFGGVRIEVNKGGIWLAADFAGVGRVDGVVNAVDFQLSVAGTEEGGPLPAGVEFTRRDAFGGSLYWIAPGQTVETWLGLYHRSAGHYDFGPYPVQIQRRSPETDGGPPAL